ncbi:AP-2 complex subunit alpha-2 (100 kDa coated vesicle protein C) (Adaptor protein complex AP-2 subunit alpha-2) (Adaptor-related protein complex 2 subunit alpha-2) (Alpha-adaptin C) (Alpha2-adaptin) (Clathrin assembly protein complex 2 alpha-C large chain) (Plasma membrane adaptor HA2/AP2 adaptin alpha C subunit) [Durusdinium trenchii]|uniref:AP-2 complex subunit alpha n=1 Tax=Durusdinium trenchii TaxID=1381693 RepID=A0ABP0HNC1_9DINO
MVDAFVPSTKRGLRKFINDVRGCNTLQDEQVRVRKELANIRQKFANAKALKAYDRKKYAWKLVYIYMLGHEVEFGHMEVINLASSKNNSEKLVGYVAMGVLMGHDEDLARLVINTIRSDLVSGSAFAQRLALTFTANVGGHELTQALSADVLRVLYLPESKPSTRRKATLCALSLWRVNQDLIDPSEYLSVVAIPALEQTFEMGLNLAVLGTLKSVARADPMAYQAVYPVVIRLLEKVVLGESVPSTYSYHGVACPLVQVRALEVLALYDFPTDAELRKTLVHILTKVLSCNDDINPQSMNQSNANNAVLVEAINLVIQYGEQVDREMMEKVVAILVKFVRLSDANVKYLGLAGMSKLAQMAQREGLASVLDMIRDHHHTVRQSLEDQDGSIRKRALDLMFSMCDKGNAHEIVGELVEYLKTVSYNLKADTVRKIAILCDRFSDDRPWYVDTILHLIATAGDFVPEDMWHRLVQVVTNNEDTKAYAAAAVYKMMQPSHVHETTIRVGSYLLGEFGYFLVEGNQQSAQDLFDAINQHLDYAGNKTRAMMLHAYAKLVLLYPQLHEDVTLVMDAFRDSSDPELQQRACEYFALAQQDRVRQQAVFEPMPAFPEAQGEEAAETARPNPTPESVKAVDAQVETQVEDLLNLADKSSFTPAPEPELKFGKEPRRVWLANVLCEPKGVLFEDHFVQIGVQLQFQKAAGKLMFFVGNKTGWVLDQALCTVLGNDALEVVAQPLEPAVLQPRAQSRFSVAVTCHKPFADRVPIKVSFQANGQFEFIDVDLPVSVLSFASPCSFPDADFDQRWDAMGDRVQQTTPLDHVGLERIDAVVAKLTALKLAPTLSADKRTLRGATTIQTATVNPKTGKPAVVGVLVRMTCVAGSSSLAVRAVNVAAAVGTLTTVKDVLLVL